MSNYDDYFASDTLPEEPPVQNAPPPELRRAAIPDLTLEAGLPANVDAERTILGAILLDNRDLAAVLKVLTADDLSLDSHRRILLRMADLAESGRAVDIVTLANSLATHKEIEAVGGVAYLASLTEGLPRRPVIGEYLRILKDKSLLRRTMSACSATIARAADQSLAAVDVIAELEAQIATIRQAVPQRNDSPFFVGYRTFTEKAAPEINWTVTDVIQGEGNGLVLGDSGTSKSMLVFHLALHLVSGATWFHHSVPQRKRVGLVAREDAAGLSQNRLQRLVKGAPNALKSMLDLVDLETVLYVNSKAQRETWTLQNEADVQDVIEAVKEKKIDMVFFDVFRALWEGNENDNQETSKVLQSINRIATESGCQACLVHHLSKSDRGTIFDRARGGGINGWKEWGLGLSVENPDADPADQIRKLQHHTKAGCAIAPIHYRIQGADHGVWLEEVDGPTGNYGGAESHGGKGKKKREPQKAMNFTEREEDTSFEYRGEF